MFNFMSNFLSRCVKRLFNSIKDDCISDIIGYGVFFLIVIISISVSAFVDNSKISFGIIASIVIVIFLLVFFYKRKE
ncbi:hypothetical protein EcCFBP13530_01840 [Enterobacter cancerogenus]|uniref:Uncharacterized protein n=1 Tax=Enterobacter cancerogenus TaxID=69218 RepID=A0AB38P889_9ENTR|nr:hypothetical protein EcCFBP13530_01840 [Enterobacter cancerogenus]